MMRIHAAGRMTAMPSKRSDVVRDYAFGDRVLALRKQARLTQAEFAVALGASKRTVEGWEAGLAYPGVDRLTALITFSLDRGLFTPGQEKDEATALWDIVRQRASQRIPAFDARTFVALQREAIDVASAVPSLSPEFSPAPWHDWGDAPVLPVVRGREQELATLARWIREEHCYVVEILGAGGVGKSTLAAQLAHNLEDEFAAVYWRSLRNALAVDEWLAGAIAAFSAGHMVAPDGFEARLGLLLELLHAQRVLLVLDNLEGVLEPGAPQVRYLPGYEGYGTVLACLADRAHQGCLVLTSREQPLPTDGAVVRSLRLEGLQVAEGRALLGNRALTGDAETWQTLIARYSGNPLALRVVGETISKVFGGDIAAFLAQDTTVFGGIRHLLGAQVGRLSTLELAILTWLAVEREPVRFGDLVAGLGPGVPRGNTVDAVEALQRRSLLEWGPGGRLSPQPLVLEYASTRLIATIVEEILANEPALLTSIALLKATARDYVRRSQEQLIALPLLGRLQSSLGNGEAVERRLLTLLEIWRGQNVAEQGYGPGNVVNLLRLLRGNLRGLDLSKLAVRHAYVQGVEMQDTSLAGSHLSEVVLAESLDCRAAVALRADGVHLLAGTSTHQQLALDAGTYLHTLQVDRCYERLDITGLTGVTEAQRSALLALGAVERAPVRATQQSASSMLPLPGTAAPALPPGAAPAVILETVQPPTNLAPARASFVGRTAELVTLRQILDPASPSGMRLLTLSGVAGCGKTRLAMALADSLLATFKDGVWVVELGPLPPNPDSDPSAVTSAVLTALGLQEQSGHTLLDTLLAHLQTRRLLLVLDNCEQVVAACATLAARLLVTCPELWILATSQYALGVASETVQPVTPLTLPSLPEGTPEPQILHLLAQSEAVQLFVERGRAARPGFSLSASTAASVVAICRRLDGLPLAIELAAARLNVLPLEEILARLDDRFRLLRSGGRTSADRHLALQATMDWSYGLLEPSAQAVFRRLGVFAGGWDVAAAEAVCGGDGIEARAVLELLDALLDRSLVYVHQSKEVPRYGMLETVRHYSLQQLERAGETGAVRDRHLIWCALLAEQAAPALLGPEQTTWLARLEREHDNLRAALQWALERGQGTLGLRVAGGIWKFWLRRGHQREGRHWLAALLALPGDDDDVSTVARATALEGAAWLAEDKHDFAQASALFAQSSALRRAAGQEERTAGLLINAAMEARASGNYGPATALLQECAAQNRRLGRRGRAMHGGLEFSLSLLALVLREQGEHMHAYRLCEECLALSREVGDAEGIAIALLSLSDLARDQGETRRVNVLCEECLACFRDLGHRWGIGFSLNNLALAACLDGDLALAADYAEESAVIFRELQAWPSLAEVLITLSRIRETQGAIEVARPHLVEALELAAPAGPRIFMAAALEELGVQEVRQGHARSGLQLLAAAAALRQAMTTPIRPVDRLRIEQALAAAHTALGADVYAHAWATGQALPLAQIVTSIAAG
jgi:non-specific serine/threonine protein kinase